MRGQAGKMGPGDLARRGRGFIGGGDGEAGKLNSKRDPGDFEASKVVSV